VADINDVRARYFDERDLASLSALEVPLSTSRSATLIDLLLSWSGHIDKIASDLVKADDDRTVWGAHDLVAALYIRDRIEGCLADLETQLGLKVGRFLVDADERFNSLTDFDDRGLVEVVDGTSDPGRGWWWRRIPKAGPIHREIIRLYGRVRRDDVPGGPS
jgi:hypothetical protein